MAPATRPALSWSPPRVALTSWTWPASKVSGRAPYLRTLARSVASDWVKFPVICAWPPTIGPLLSAGAETTRPSSTMPKRLSGSLCWASRRVGSANLGRPLPVKFRLTCQPPVATPWLLLASPAEALLTSVPRTSAGPRRYFSVPSRRQVTIGFFGSSAPGLRRSRCSVVVSEQSSRANCCCSAPETPLAPLGGGTVAEALGLAAGVALGDGLEDELAAFTVRGIARPLVVLLGDGLADGVADGLAEPDGVAPPLALGDGVPVETGAPAAAASTGRNRSSAVCWTVARMFLSCLP